MEEELLKQILRDEYEITDKFWLDKINDYILANQAHLVNLFTDLNDIIEYTVQKLDENEFNNFERQQLIFDKSHNTEISTRKQSLYKLDCSNIDDRVLKVIQANPGIARHEIEQELVILTQTLSGAITRLKAARQIVCFGRTFNNSTKRIVTTYKAIV
jgi:hypothetical protein